MEQPKKFLIIQTAFIGDVILATAVLEKLHAFFPSSQIDFLVRKGNESLVQYHPFIHQCLVWNKKEKKYRDLFRLLKCIRNEKYDKVINLQRFAASGFLTAFSNAKEKIGFDKNPFSFLFDVKVPHIIGSLSKPGQHEVKRCLDAVSHFTDSVFVKPKLYPSVSDFSTIESFTSKGFYTISPASVWFTKQTPVSVWQKLISRFNDKRVFLLGAPGDVSLCEEIANGLSNVTILAGKLSLLQSAALMSKADMNFTNDSAPLHLCSAMNAPVNVAFCSTIPEFGFGPLSDVAHIVQTKVKLDCRPCGLHGFNKCPLGHFKCANLNADDFKFEEKMNAVF